MKNLFYALCIVLCSSAFGEDSISLRPPGFKGTLLSPSPYFPAKGHQYYETYVTWTERDYRFNKSWDTTPIRHLDTFLSFTIFKFGISPRIEIDITPQWLYHNSEGPHAWRLGDFNFAFAIKLMEENKLTNRGWPTIKFRIGTTIPFGKYDRLDPKKHLTDAGGIGSANPNLSLLFGKHLHITPSHWVCIRAGYLFSFGTQVGIDGASIYGDADTIGHKVYLGNRWEANLGLEATLIGKLALIGDLVAVYRDSTHYSKRKQPDPSSLVFTALPGLEYDFSKFIGILAGPAIDFAGRNGDSDLKWLFSVKIHN